MSVEESCQFNAWPLQLQGETERDFGRAALDIFTLFLSFHNTNYYLCTSSTVTLILSFILGREKEKIVHDEMHLTEEEKIAKKNVIWFKECNFFFS